jgi:hypothetical protein
MFANRNGIYWLILTTLLVVCPGYAAAADWVIDTKVNIVEGTYIPTGIFFWVATPPPATARCLTDDSGTVLAYRARAVGDNEKQENIKAVYDLLLTAIAANVPVRIGGLNGNQTPNDQCNVEIIYLLSEE